MKRITLLSIFALLFHALHAQKQIDQTALSANVVRDANAMAALFNAADYKGFLKYIHPVRIQAGGGEEKMISQLNALNEQLKSKQTVIKGTVFDQPSEIVRSKNELQCTISQHTELKPPKGTVITYTTIIAFSNDEGKTWKFVDANKLDITILRKMFPNLSSKITLPPWKQPEVHAE